MREGAHPWQKTLKKMLTDSTQNRADGVQKRAYIFTITRSSYALIIIGRKKHYSA